MGFLGLRKIVSNAFLSRSACVHANLSHAICRVITPPKCSSTTQRPQHKLATTRSPKWMGLVRGLSRGMWADSAYGRGMIIGIIDTGITPAHPSFNDNNIPPPLKRLKGKSFLNNKIVSIEKYHNQDIRVDLDGHGTHVASIAAGNFVSDANVSNQLRGTASGIAPHASLAIYQTAYESDGENMDLRDTFSDAIDDGVDVINVSMAIRYGALKKNLIALGAFDATTKGVLVCCAAGNTGPSPSTVTNSTPWVLTVGAANIDRIVKATIRLGNTDLVYGEWINQPTSFPRDSYQIVDAHGKRIRKNYFNGKIAFYDPTLFDSEEEARERYEMIKGRVVAIIEPKGVESAYTLHDHYRDITTAKVSKEDGSRIMKYVDSAKHPTASLKISGTDHTPPEVASFSGRGPSRIFKGIIKPDVIAPGVEILGADKDNEDGVKYIVCSGTSMACAHVTGVAALIKQCHPDWSPAMIKSAIMTTAYSVKKNGEPIQEERKEKAGLYSIGSGHVNAIKANDPGIVFDVETDEYVAYLLGLGSYSKKDLMIMLRREIIPEKGMEGAELNLPSFCLPLKPGDRKFYKRIGQNVGNAKSTYFVKVNCQRKGVKVTVVPEKIQFSEVNEKITFKVSFELEEKRNWKNTRFVEGSIALVSDKQIVTMPFRIEVIRGN